jgi:Tfp pilus assembly protein PilV
MLEVALLTVFLLIAVGGLSGAVLSSLRVSRATEESARADAAIRALAADMQSTAFNVLYRQYNGTRMTMFPPRTPGRETRSTCAA